MLFAKKKNSASNSNFICNGYKKKKKNANKTNTK